MMITNAGDTAKLLEIYREEPCRTLPNAFWKSEYRAGTTRLEVKKGRFGVCQSLALWHNERLMSLWFDDPSQSPLTKQQIKSLHFALVHNNTLSIFDLQKFSSRTSYFRLKFTGAPPVDSLPSGYVFETFDPQRDILTGTSLISACYPNMLISEEIVQGWLHHPVYIPGLWVWIKDIQTGRYAALGIAEIDLKVPEASLEWVQVHPAYQRKGLGKALVCELLRRIGNEVAFTTVSGDIDNPSQPEALYRQCGFKGSDIWWLLKA